MIVKNKHKEGEKQEEKYKRKEGKLQRLLTSTGLRIRTRMKIRIFMRINQELKKLR